VWDADVVGAGRAAGTACPRRAHHARPVGILASTATTPETSAVV
jgi:hypothetical protein